mgnify:CR=1
KYRSSDIAQFYCLTKVHRDQLRDTLFTHGDAVKSVHPRHGHSVVRDDHKTGGGRFRYLFDHRTEPFNI